MTKLRLLLILFPILLVNACGIIPENKEDTLDWSAQKLYSKASDAMNSGNYEDAIKFYELLEASYPFGKYAMQAQLGVAYAYYKGEEPQSALAAADRFIKLHPRSPHVDYVHYLKGLINFNRSIGFIERFLPVDSSQRDPASALISFNDFAQLIEKFPNSEYAGDARKRLIYLRNNLAKHEIHVATYYLKKGAYPAAINRCKAVLENYSNTPSARNALELMIQAYEHLGMSDLAADTQRVLKINLEQGNFATAFSDTTEDMTISHKVWDFLQLDEG